MHQPPRRPIRHFLVAIAAVVFLAGSYSATRANPLPAEAVVAHAERAIPATHRSRMPSAQRRTVAAALIALCIQMASPGR